jgi:hypothetical protein
MRRLVRTTAQWLPAFGLAWMLSRLSFAAPLEVESVWANQVAPMLDRHCFKCHGGVRQRGELDLRSLQNILKGGESGPAVMPGQPEQSKIYQVVQPGSDPHMPPKKQLNNEELALLKQWLAALPVVDSFGIKTNDSTWHTDYMHALERSRKSVWTPSTNMSATAVIERFIELGWNERNVRGAELSSDSTFVRRVYLDLAGRIPSRDELEKVLRDPSESRRERLIIALLESDDYARHMREVFDVVLMERRGARNEGQRSENHWFAYLEESFRANRPWNKIVHDLILARPDDSKDRGAAWFLYERRNNHQAIAEAVAPLAFGVQIGCAQCHNDPMAWEIEQRHYWGLVAAFNRSKNVESAQGPGVSESAVGGFVTFANLKKESQPALLAFLNGKVVEEKRPGDGESEKDEPDLYLVAPPTEKEKPKKPAVPKNSRREALANAATHENPRLAKAFVNRIWAMLLGRGLVHPVDRLDSRHLPSHPDLLEWLARDFEENGYDGKRLIRQIVLSRTYQLDSRPAPGEKAPPQAFARALDKPLSAEQLFRSFLIATGNSADSDGKIAGRPEADYRRAFVERFPDLFPEEYNASLQQATFISNSALLDQLLSRASGNSTDRILQLASTEAQVCRAFELVLGRPPADDELEQARLVLARRPGEPGVKQLLWALLASAEFQLNH